MNPHRLSPALIGLFFFLGTTITNAKTPSRLTQLDSMPAKAEITQTPVGKDTVNALENLFKRKRRFGIVKTIVFGSAAFYAVNHTLHPSETNSNNKGWQKDVEEDATIFAICAGAMGTINGQLQVFRYSKSALKRIIEDRNHGIPYPKELIAKLRPTDFR